jgi:hypothetical protein
VDRLAPLVLTTVAAILQNARESQFHDPTDRLSTDASASGVTPGELYAIQ